MSLHHQQQSLQQQQNFLLPPLPPSPPLSNTENFIQGPAVMASSESTSGHHRGSVDGLGLSNCSTQLELSTASVHPTPPEKHMDPSRPITHLDVMGSMAPPPPQFTHHPSSQDSASAAMAMGYALPVGALGGPGANSGQGSGAFGAPDTHEMLENLKLFLATAPSTWDPDQVIKHFPLPSGETVSCVLWSNLFHITGTDIVRSLTFRFAAFGRPVKNMKKFEEGPGIDATLEEPRSEFLEFLFKANCIRTQKKQKVFYWFSVPHDRLFMVSLTVLMDFALYQNSWY
ncbi:STE like transcription factor-domain-containing protein [Chytridium lagenaria]|nr:STE like transcription factor-domain-containing protein [Chytridium lagenaria]